MKLDPASIISEYQYPAGVGITEALIHLCMDEGFNTIYDDGDEVVMRNADNLVFLTIKADDHVYATYYSN